MFVHTHNPVKEKQRVIFESYIKKNSKPKSMLTLSADNFIFENKFSDLNITSCEFNQETYLRAIKNKPDNVTLKYKDIFQEKPLYDVIWLDFCISLSVRIINETISYLQQSKASIVGITFQAQREHLVKDLSLYGASTMDEFRTETFPDLIYALTGYKLAKLSKYRTDVNMIMYIFKKQN
jgi:hypothetical protein